MTSRELRRQRRAAERKASKLEKKNQAAVASPFVNQLSLADLAHVDDDFEMQEAVPTLLSFNTFPTNPKGADASQQSSDEHACPRTGEPDIQTDSRAFPNHTTRNRENAQHSTGPRTDAGKTTSSGNSLKHGLASGTLIIPGEDASKFETLLANLMQEFKPATPTEVLLVEEIAKSHWLAGRATRLQNSCFEGMEVNAKSLSLFLRYQSTHQRNFFKSLNELRKGQKERRKLEASAPQSNEKPKSGFVSQTQPATTPSLGFVSQSKPLDDAVMEEKVKNWLMEKPAAA